MPTAPPARRVPWFLVHRRAKEGHFQREEKRIKCKAMAPQLPTNQPTKTDSTQLIHEILEQR